MEIIMALMRPPARWAVLSTVGASACTGRPGAGHGGGRLGAISIPAGLFQTGGVRRGGLLPERNAPMSSEQLELGPG